MVIIVHSIYRHILEHILIQEACVLLLLLLVQKIT